jgi:rhodanese-related sulfurtransferase
VHLLAMVAQNQRRGLARGMRLDESADGVLLDVRSPEEFARGTLRGAINVPLDELRTRVSELDPRRKTIAFCQVGQRGYIVQRMLQQMGFDDVHNLKGGYTMAKATRKALAQTA